jgi:hypothetical protein
MDQIGTNPEFYKNIKGSDEGEKEDEDENNNDSDHGIVHYDEVNSSTTIDAVIADIIGRDPVDCLADIYADKDDGLSNESDVEDRGTGSNLDMYTGHEFSTCNATEGWMEWNSK